MSGRALWKPNTFQKCLNICFIIGRTNLEIQSDNSEIDPFQSTIGHFYHIVNSCIAVNDLIFVEVAPTYAAAPVPESTSFAITNPSRLLPSQVKYFSHVDMFTYMTDATMINGWKYWNKTYNKKYFINFCPCIFFFSFFVSFIIRRTKLTKHEPYRYNWNRNNFARQLRGRKSTNEVYEIKYVSIETVADDLDALDYTPAREMLNCNWCKWTDSDRAARSSRLGEAKTSKVAAAATGRNTTWSLRR